MSKTSVRLCAALLFCAVFCAGTTLWSQSAPMVSDDAAAARIAWWHDAKFGMFLHWGLYSIPARGEWVQWKEQIPVEEYARLAGQFHPDQFDPDGWAVLAKDAGMNYMVLTARHHDGFALFDDPGSDFTAMKSAAHRDFVAAYVKAARDAGLRVGLYYSPLDWRFPGFFFPGIYQSSAEALRAQYHRQLHELATNYGKIDILWFDGGGGDWLGFGGVRFDGAWHGRPPGQRYTGSFSWQDDQAAADLRKFQPSIIMNDRTDAPADFRSREGDRALGKFDNQTPWELCTTLAEGAWGYQRDAKIKSLDALIQLLVGAVGRDGNMLLNVGPRADGQIDPAYAARLREIGAWLSKNGESIYGTRGGPYLPGDYGVSTYRKNVIYLHLLHFNGHPLTLPQLPAEILSCSVLTGGNATCTQTGSGVQVVLDGSADATDTIVVMTLASSAAKIDPIAVAAGPAVH